MTQYRIKNVTKKLCALLNQTEGDLTAAAEELKDDPFSSTRNALEKVYQYLENGQTENTGSGIAVELNGARLYLPAEKLDKSYCYAVLKNDSFLRHTADYLADIEGENIVICTGSEISEKLCGRYSVYNAEGVIVFEESIREDTDKIISIRKKRAEK